MPVLRTLRQLAPGLALVLAIGLGATLLATAAKLERLGFGPLSLAILLGALLGNLFSCLHAPAQQPGLAFAQRRFLRLGVALFGFNLSLQQLLEVGRNGLLADLFMVGSTLGLGYFLGTRWLGLDRESALLTSAGSAICGAAAVVATVPVLRLDTAKAAEQTAAAIATVVLFGTLAMLLYPLLAHWVWQDHPGFGIYVGSTVHEVAQVVAIGHSLGDAVAREAMIVKMLRVLLLVPFLLSLSALLGGKGKNAGRRQSPCPGLPWASSLAPGSTPSPSCRLPGWSFCDGWPPSSSPAPWRPWGSRPPGCGCAGPGPGRCSWGPCCFASGRAGRALQLVAGGLTADQRSRAASARLAARCRHCW